MRTTKTSTDIRTTARLSNCICKCLIGAMLFTAHVAFAQYEIVSNLLVNGEFDTDIAGWELESLTDTDTGWSTEGNTTSGSFFGAQHHAWPSPFTFPNLGSQCVPVEPGEVYQIMGSVKTTTQSGYYLASRPYLIAGWRETGCPAVSDRLLPGNPELSAFVAPGRPFGGYDYFGVLQEDGWVTTHGVFRVPEGYPVLRFALSMFNPSENERATGTEYDDISFGKIKPDLAAELDFGGQTSYAGSEVTFDVSIRNDKSYANTARDVTARILSNDRLRYVSETCPGDMANTTQGGDRWISWFNIPTLDPGTTFNCTITAEVEPGPAGSLFSQLEIECPGCGGNPNDDIAHDRLTIDPRADIAVNISAQQYQSIEDKIEVQVELENLGTKVWSGNVLVRRPAGAELDPGRCIDGPITVLEEEYISFPAIMWPGPSRDCTLKFHYTNPEEQQTFSIIANNQSGDDYDPSNDTDSVTLTTVSLRVNWAGLDRGDTNPGDGACFTSLGRNGVCTLRGAIEEANALPGYQVVVLPYVAAGYPLMLAGGDQHLTITDTVEIRGERQDNIPPTIYGDWSEPADYSRIFVIDSPTGRVTLRNLNLIGQNEFVAGNGGLVRINDTSVWMSNTRLEGGASNGRGGAIYSNDDLDLRNVFIVQNTAIFGAGIAFEPATSDDVLTLNRTRIHDNYQTPLTPQSQGGGIWADGGTLIIERSAIDNNISTRGGGLALLGDAVGLIENTTISTNEANVAGGGIWASQAAVDINFATFANNNADSSSNASGEGGGIYATTSSTVRVSNSIFSNNQAQVDGIYPKGDTCFGSMISQGFNTFIPSTTFDDDCAVNINNGDNNTAATILAALAPTGDWQVPYHDLIGEGQDIDRASPDCPSIWSNSQYTYDQRGLIRPKDGNMDGILRCDKGAIESVGNLPDLAVSCPSDVTVEAGSTTTVSCSVSSINGAAGDVYFSCLGAPPSCDFDPEPLTLAAGVSSDVDVSIYGNALAGSTQTITVDAILSPARGQAEINVTTTVDTGGETILIAADITGSGAIISSPEGLECSSSCSESFPLTNAPIQLTAEPEAGWKFDSWTGDCAGNGTLQPDGSSRCIVTSSEDRTVGAVFVEDQNITVSVAISGQGHVVSTPAGIDCPGTCSAEFANSGDNIILTTNLDFGWYFTGWSGDCGGTSDCSLPRNSDQTVTADFSFGPVPTDVIFENGFE